MSKNNSWIIILLMMLVFIINFEYSVVMALAPKIAATYEIDGSNITYLFIGFSLMGLFAPFLGYYADRFGIKKLMIFGLAVFSLGAFVIVSTGKVAGYFIGRSLMGIGYYSLLSLTTSYLSSLVTYNKLGAVSGFHRLAVAGAFFASPLVGSYFALNYSVSTLYALIGGVSLFLMGATFFIPDIKNSTKMDLSNVKRILQSKDSLQMIIVIFGLTVPSVYIFNYFSIYLSQENFSQTFITSLYSTIAVGSLIAGAVILFLSDRLGKTKVALTGIILSILAILPLAILDKFILIIASLLLGLGFDTIWGLVFPISSQIFKTGKSTFLTILSLAMGLTNVFSNITAPLVNKTGGFPAHIFVATGSLLIAILTFNSVIKRHQKIL